MDTSQSDPLMSIVIVSPDCYATVRPLTRHLQKQTIRDRLEVVYLFPNADDFAFEKDDLEGFHGHQLLEVGPIRSLNGPRAIGIQQARAPIVALTEDHCYPAPGWAEALVRAHEGPWAGVAPLIGLANHHGYVSWANYLIQYIGWIPPQSRGAIPDLPGHNSTYKRDVLLEYGEDLERMLTFEYTMHRDLRRRGHELYLEPDAISYHLFMTQARPFDRENYNIGRACAYTQAHDLGLARRLLRFATTPLVPIVRTWRTLSFIRERGWQRLLPGVLPPLLRGYFVSAIGEAMGWLFGIGDALEQALELDFHRERFVDAEDAARITCDEPYDFSNQPVEPTID